MTAQNFPGARFPPSAARDSSSIPHSCPCPGLFPGHGIGGGILQVEDDPCTRLCCSSRLSTQPHGNHGWWHVRDRHWVRVRRWPMWPPIPVGPHTNFDSFKFQLRWWHAVASPTQHLHLRNAAARIFADFTKLVKLSVQVTLSAIAGRAAGVRLISSCSFGFQAQCLHKAIAKYCKKLQANSDTCTSKVAEPRLRPQPDRTDPSGESSATYQFNEFR